YGIKPAETLQDAAKNTCREAQRYGRAHDQKQQPGGSHEVGRNSEQGVHVTAHRNCNGHGEHPNGGVSSQTGVDDAGKPFDVVSRGVSGNVADDRGPDAQVEKAVVAGDGKDQYPGPERRIAKAMQDKRGEKDSNQNVDSQAEPAGA